MKRIIASCLVIILVVSCEKNLTGPEGRNLYLGLKSEEILVSGIAFGLELFEEVMLGAADDENVMISPLSVALALGMTCNGSATTTRAAMEATLKLQGFTEEEINRGYKEIIDQMLDLDPSVVMQIANSIWSREGFPIEEEFTRRIKEYFYAETCELDFNRLDAEDIINQWVSDHTSELIEEIIDKIPPEAVMYLINAIYFKGTWTYEFNPDETQLNPFYPELGNAVEVSTMFQEATFDYFQNDLFQLVELPYGEKKFSMLIFLPSANYNCGDIRTVLNHENLNIWSNELSKTNVNVQLPKFRFETFKLLNDPLTDMGMGIAFTDSADFTHINPDGNLFISRVLHKTFIDVNEEGTEAAAVSAVEVGLTSAGQDPGMVQFIANRPFLFLIRENSTGSILFMGKLSLPEY